MLREVTPTFVVRNLAPRTITVLGSIPIRGGQQVDLFKSNPGLSEQTVIDALRSPDGELYKKIFLTRELSLDKVALFCLENARVHAGNLSISGEPGQGKFITVDEAGKLAWEYVDAENKLEVQYPLARKNNVLSIEQASEATNGYLTKDDWLLFKGKSTGFRIWQYQDFQAPVPNNVTISKFENGTNFPFESKYIVDGSAIAVDAKNIESKPHKGILSRLMGSKGTEVQQHIGDTILFDEDPDPSVDIRVYFLVTLPVATKIPEDYKHPPRLVRKERIDYIDAIDIDYGGSKAVRGDKKFEDSVEVKKGAKVSDRLVVEGEFKTDTIKITHQPAHHYVLSSNPVGEGKWSPATVVSSSPPKNHYDGQLWVKSPEYELYVYDASRNKWLSVFSSELSGGLSNTAVTNLYLKGEDNISMDINSEVLPFDATLVALSASGEVRQNWKAEVHADGKLIEGAVLHVVHSDRAIFDRLDVDFRAGQKIQLFANGERISMPKIKAIFRKRFG